MSAKSQHNNILLAILGFISVIVLVAVIGYFTLDRTEEIIQGEVEVSEYRVACKLPGRITELRVKEGDYVHKGDVLAVLEIPEVNEQEKVAEAAANATEALSDLAKAPTRKEMIQSAYQVYQQAKSANRIAEKTFGRMDRLFKEGVISAQKRDEAQAAYETTQAAVEVAKSQWELAKNGSREESKRAAQKSGTGGTVGRQCSEIGAQGDRSASHPRRRGFDHLSKRGRTRGFRKPHHEHCHDRRYLGDVQYP